MDNLRSQCVARVNEVIADARVKYGDLPPIAIRFFAKGRAAGMAGRDVSGYYVRFNLDALEKDLNHMMTATIPHEIAHIVCFVKKWDNGHGRMWKIVNHGLGGTGGRTHCIAVEKARIHRKFEYRGSLGTMYYVGSAVHCKIQLGQGRHNKRTGEKIRAEHYTGIQK